ncbi:MAG: xanthine dehydrogenase family protein subunit M [Hyphomicrobiaceae bacterium]
MYSFDYQRPTSIAEAAALFDKSEEAAFLAGGMTLLPTLKQRLARPSALVDLSRVRDLKGISQHSGAIGIGAMTTHHDVASSGVVKAAIPALARLAGNIGDPHVRYRGTIGGSLANNDPAADYPAAALALGAVIITNKREIRADDYFTGLFSTALEAGEVITGVGLPVAEKAGYAKFEQRASRYALVGVFVARTSGGVRVAVTGAGAEGVFRCSPIEQALTASFSPDAAKAVKVSADGLMGDIHGSAEYRAALIPVMAGRAVAAALG